MGGCDHNFLAGRPKPLSAIVRGQSGDRLRAVAQPDADRGIGDSRRLLNGDPLWRGEDEPEDRHQTLGISAAVRRAAAGQGAQRQRCAQQ